MGGARGQHEAEEFIVMRKLLATNFQVLDTSGPIPRPTCYSPVVASFTSLHTSCPNVVQRFGLFGWVFTPAEGERIRPRL
jgi:hypothetical protein